MRRSFFAWRRDKEEGFVIVWMTVVLVLLLSVAAFAVDLVHAYVEAEKAQNAADAAALAGSTLVPNNPDCVAPTDRAEQLARDNGFDAGADPRIAVNATCTGPNEMTVQVKRTFDTFFARIMGFDALTVKRTGVAQYDAPLKMGSPTNWLGSVPVCPDNTTPPTTLSCLNASETFADGFLWGSIQGPEGDKAQGNALTNNNCVEQASDNCDASATPPNTDHLPGSNEYYLLNNPQSEAGNTLDIYGYDAGFVPTGIRCVPTENNIGGYATVPSVNAPWVALQPQFCTGDTSFGTPQGVDTTFTVFKPDGDGDPTNNTQQLCSVLIPGKGSNGHPNNAVSDAYTDLTTRPFFHQWRSICSIGGSEGGDYVVRVTASGVGKGTNQFGLMGLHNGTSPGHISVFTRDKLALAAVDPNGGGSKFYLTRVFPSERSRRLILSFFDLGDNSFSVLPAEPVRTGRLTVQASGDVFSGFRSALGTTGSGMCAYRPPPITDTGPRTLPLTSALVPPNTTNGCSFEYDSNNTSGSPTWDSRWVDVQVELPGKNDVNGNGYNCNSADPLGCWLILNIQPTGRGALTDATTWSAAIEGGPVRLVG